MADVNAGRGVPSWAAGLVSVLSRDRPSVVTLSSLAGYIAELGLDRKPDRVARDLQQLGWLASLHLKGAWAFVPAGESPSDDRHLDLLGWHERDPGAVFALAGEATAWHLGYLPRRFVGTVAVWLPPGDRAPHGLRRFVSEVRIGWPVTSADELGPSSRLLHRKGLDLTGWSAGLPALGPDALLVQLAVRPGSFRTWGDLISRLDVLAADCDPERIITLLDGQSSSAWQRAAYLLDCGDSSEAARHVLDHRPLRRLTAAPLGDGPEVVWSGEFGVNDRLVAPLQRLLGKA